MGPPELGDGDLRLRPWREADGDVVTAGADDVLARRLGLPPVPWPAGLFAGREQAWAHEWASRDRAGWVLEIGGRVGGFVELRYSGGGHRGELTWALLPGARGVGAARRAVTLVLDWAFARGLQRAEAWVEPDNHASLGVAAACGLRREGLARQQQVIAGRARDLVLLARLRTDVDPAVDPVPTMVASQSRVSQAAGLVVRTPDGRVLLLETSYKPAWEVPGGMVEAGEDLLGAVVREGREELGVDLPVGPLLVLDRCAADGRRDEVQAALFDGGVVDPDVVSRFTFPDGEIVAARWCTRAEVVARTSPNVTGRLLAALDALDSGRLPGPTLLLREGIPLGRSEYRALASEG